jgi:hypothetical protein
MITLSQGPRVRLADTNLQMFIRSESETADQDDILHQCRCAWVQDGVLVTSLVNRCNLLFRALSVGILFGFN